MSPILDSKCLPSICPFEWLCHCLVEVLDKRQNLGVQIIDRSKAGPPEQLPDQNTKPYFDLVHPRSVYRRVVKDN